MVLTKACWRCTASGASGTLRRIETTTENGSYDHRHRTRRDEAEMTAPRATPRTDALVAKNRAAHCRSDLDAIDLARRLERDLAELRELLREAADEMKESCEFEGQLTSMKVLAERIAAVLSGEGEVV